jgi:hemoglobin
VIPPRRQSDEKSAWLVSTAMMSWNRVTDQNAPWKPPGCQWIGASRRSRAKYGSATPWRNSSGSETSISSSGIVAARSRAARRAVSSVIAAPWGFAVGRVDGTRCEAGRRGAGWTIRSTRGAGTIRERPPGMLRSTGTAGAGPVRTRPSGAAMDTSLYQRLGGAGRLSAIVAAALDRHAANPLLASRLRGRDLLRLKHLCVHYLAAGFGGPATYEGVDLREVRAATGEREFGALVSDVVATLDEHGIAPRDVDTVVGVLQTLRAGSWPPGASPSGAGIAYALASVSW